MGSLLHSHTTDTSWINRVVGGSATETFPVLRISEIHALSAGCTSQRGSFPSYRHLLGRSKRPSTTGLGLLSSLDISLNLPISNFRSSAAGLLLEFSHCRAQLTQLCRGQCGSSVVIGAAVRNWANLRILESSSSSKRCSGRLRSQNGSFGLLQSS